MMMMKMILAGALALASSSSAFAATVPEFAGDEIELRGSEPDPLPVLAEYRFSIGCKDNRAGTATFCARPGWRGMKLGATWHPETRDRMYVVRVPWRVYPTAARARAKRPVWRFVQVRWTETESGELTGEAIIPAR